MKKFSIGEKVYVYYSDGYYYGIGEISDFVGDNYSVRIITNNDQFSVSEDLIRSLNEQFEASVIPYRKCPEPPEPFPDDKIKSYGWPVRELCWTLIITFIIAVGYVELLSYYGINVALITQRNQRG